MEREDVLNQLGRCINEADSRDCNGIGDLIFEVIVWLREEWGME